MINLVRFLMVVFCFCYSCTPYSETEYESNGLNDGAYLHCNDNLLNVRMIENGHYNEFYISSFEFMLYQKQLNVKATYHDLMGVFDAKPNYKQNYYGVDQIIVLSDAHGQYESYLKLLIANKVINHDLNWSFGTGHFVFNGDMFDRGDKVTEILWHLFSLEKQAKKAGGKVHVLLGNHEDLVLSGDLTYLSEKYKKVEEIMQMAYSDLYSESSVLGKWLRNKPVIISINDIVFTHGGISKKVVDMSLSLEQINRICAEKIIGVEHPYLTDEKVMLLKGFYGPMWYRGYFNDSLFNEKTLDEILEFYDKERIVVGHTTIDSIVSLYQNKVIGIDAGMGFGLDGALLIISEGTIYTGNINGERIAL